MSGGIFLLAAQWWTENKYIEKEQYSKLQLTETERKFPSWVHSTESNSLDQMFKLKEKSYKNTELSETPGSYVLSNKVI